MRATYLEIYQEEVRDLLSKNPNQRLEVKESAEKGVYVKGLVQFVVKSVAEINSVLQVCLACPSRCTPVYEVIDMVASSRPPKHTSILYILYYIGLYCAVLYCTVLYNCLFFCIVLHCTAMTLARAH